MGSVWLLLLAVLAAVVAAGTAGDQKFDKFVVVTSGTCESKGFAPIIVRDGTDVKNDMCLQAGQAISGRPAKSSPYVGCYQDNGHRDLDYGPRRYGFNTLTCDAACSNWGNKQYTYFGLQNGGWCCCGNSYSTSTAYPKISDSRCAQRGFPCKNEAGLSPTRYCGGPWANAIYRTGSFQKTGTFTLRSKNYPAHTVKNQGNQAKIVSGGTLDKFELMSPGLTGQVGTVSFKFNGKFLRHAGYVMWMHSYQNSNLFRRDSTFWPREDKYHSGYYSYESENYRNHFIRHAGYRLRISREEGSNLYKDDASWKLEEAPADHIAYAGRYRSGDKLRPPGCAIHLTKFNERNPQKGLKKTPVAKVMQHFMAAKGECGVSGYACVCKPPPAPPSCKAPPMMIGRVEEGCEGKKPGEKCNIKCKEGFILSDPKPEWLKKEDWQTTSQSRWGWGAPSSRAIDGNNNPSWGGRGCTHTHRQRNAWWKGKLDDTYQIKKVRVTNRHDCCWNRLRYFEVLVDGKRCYKETDREQVLNF
jgi:hypothetical protein